MPHPVTLAQQFILGALAAALVISIIWLTTGHTPTWWVTFLATEALTLTVTTTLKIRRHREQARLQADFERPAFGENWPR